MGDRTGRLAAVFGALVALWIVVYWVWEPRNEPVRVTFAEPPIEQIMAGLDSRTATRTTTTQTQTRAKLPEDQAGSVGNGSSDQQLSDAPFEIAQEPTPTRGAPRTARQPESGVQRPEFVQYRVRAGDTMESIAQAQLGTGSLWTAIARANPLTDPNRIKPGDVLNLPVDPNNIQGRPVGAPTTPTSTPAPPTTKAAPKTVEYTVKEGDTLGGISFAFYGSARHAESIFRANRDVLGSIDALRVGQVLKIPPTPGGE